LRATRVSANSFARIAVDDSIYNGWGANQGFVTCREGTLVIDTGFTRASAAALLRDVRRRSSSKSTIVVNSHDHSDHVFGNSLFEPSSMIIAHANCRARLLELGDERIKGYRRFDKPLRSALKGLRISLPQVTYAKETDFMLGRTAFRLIHPEDGAHTLGDTMVLVPDEKVLFAGDVAWVDYHPNLEDANIEGWIRVLEGVSRMDVDCVVPGHGPISDKGFAAPLAKYLRRFDAGFRKLVREQVPRRSITDHLELPGAEDWLLKMILQRNIDLLYDKYAKSDSAWLR